MFQQILDRIPQYSRFLTVEELDQSTMELASRCPDTVEVFEAGKSGKGHPIYCLKIGSGSKNALLYGCPHPNEPVGAMMLEYFSTCLAEDKAFRESFDYTWYIVKCSDPDATMLNEGWFSGPYTIERYARNFFRPSATKQVDWTFPIKYKKLEFTEPIDETKALMRVIEQAAPTFVYPLHNSGFGGAYWYMSHSLPLLHKRLNQIPEENGIPLSLGEPEAPYSVVFGPAIYKTLSMRDEYDYLENYGNVDPSKVIRCGTCGLDYAMEIGGEDVFGLVTEVPYFYDPRINDTSEATVLKQELLMEAFQFQKEFYQRLLQLMEQVEENISKDNPFRTAFEDIARGTLHGIDARRKHTEESVDPAEQAKVSEVFESRYCSKFYCLLSLGLLLRLLAHETKADKEGRKVEPGALLRLERVKEQAEMEFSKLCEELEEGMNYSVIPIQTLVRIQLECGLLVARKLEKDAQ